MMTSWDLAIAALAAVGAGLINALAGGGTLISFPVLVAVGVPPVAANITNAVALCPGYFGATIAQLPNLKGQRAQLMLLIPVAVLGGLAGGMASPLASCADDHSSAIPPPWGTQPRAPCSGLAHSSRRSGWCQDGRRGKPSQSCGALAQSR